MELLSDDIKLSSVEHNGKNFSNLFINTKCHNCERDVSLMIIAKTKVRDLNNKTKPFFIQWLWCPNCGFPSSLIDQNFLPNSKQGRNIRGLSPHVKEIYDEIRNVTGVNAYRASDMLCRKVLMHIAVEEDAEEGKSFSYYVDYLVEKQIISQKMKKWVDKIRIYGNEQTHEIKELDLESSKKTLQFTIQLLITIYEMNYLMENEEN